MNPVEDHTSHTTATSQPPLQNKLPKTYSITPARTPKDLTTTVQLFKSYSASLGLDLSFQDFQSELSSLPGKYSPFLGGEILLARSRTSSSEEVLGCVALRSLSLPETGKISEMKRLYVLPSARGSGLGRALATAVIETAIELGYHEVRLDTLPTMTAAQRMYVDLGFRDVEAYCFNPVEGTRYLGLDLGIYRDRETERQRQRQR